MNTVICKSKINYNEEMTALRMETRDVGTARLYFGEEGNNDDDFFELNPVQAAYLGRWLLIFARNASDEIVDQLREGEPR